MRFSGVLDELDKSGMKVFTVNDAAKIMHKGTAYASLMLSKSKAVERVERGKYFIKGTDIYAVASNLVFPSYVSLNAGLQYYGLIDQNIVRYSVMAMKRHKEIIVSGNIIEFISMNKKWFFGYVRKGDAYMADPEKLFVDCLYFGVPDFNLLKEALGNAISGSLIDAGRLEDYAIRMGKPVLANKLGFLLESAGMEPKELLKHIYTNYVHISNAGATGASKKWRVKYDR